MLDSMEIGYGIYDDFHADGGPGSGNFGHAGIPGVRGGSVASMNKGKNASSVSANKKTLATEYPDSFPRNIVQTTVKKMKSSEHYEAAKHGDTVEAQKLVQELVKDDKVKAIADAHPDAKVIAIHKIDQDGTNQIPLAYAAAYKKYGLEIDTDIVQSTTVHRTGTNDAYRMANRPTFEGKVEKGKEYIIVDDVVTIGGTVSSARNYIESNGGKVVQVTSLGATYSGHIIGIQQSTVAALYDKFGGNFDGVLKETGIAKTAKCLTEGEARYLLGRKTVDEIRNLVSEGK